MYVYASLSGVIQLNCVNLYVYNIYACIHECMFLCMYASLSDVINLNYDNLSVYNNDCLYVCMFVCICMYVCVCVVEWCYTA